MVSVSEVDRLSTAVGAVEDTVEAFDLACSRFREDSELAAVNRAGGQPVQVSPLFAEALEAALRAARLTDGDVDPTVGSAMVALGYDRDFQLVPPQGPPVLHFASVPGWQTVHLTGGAVTLGEGVSLDLGATAKALAADHAATAAAQAARCGVLVSLGGDIAVAGAPPEPGWRVRVTDDHRAGIDAPGQWISLTTGGLATSSTVIRRWRAGSRDVHHLLDPATGRPADAGWRTVSVAAATCLDANIASTAAIIRGPGAASWLRSLRLPSRVVSDDGHVVHLAGWPTDGDDLPVLVGPGTEVSA